MRISITLSWLVLAVFGIMLAGSASARADRRKVPPTRDKKFSIPKKASTRAPHFQFDFQRPAFADPEMGGPVLEVVGGRPTPHGLVPIR
jgi:hypothetical protein